MTTGFGYRLDIASNASAGNGSDFECKGGVVLFMAEATWGGGNIKLQIKSPNGTYLDISSSTLSANGALRLELPHGLYRYVITTSSAVYAYIVKM